ncbi:hypothetical protein V498_02401 [Pseudogymnoascus sp. VKM F-4517 (FW-2822)]|nr:hypothetical protein V498_02401 [Pseudogymnoascus sp. VKM F-4517 (FW-2822)]
MPVKDPVKPRDGGKLYARLLAIDSEEGNSRDGVHAVMAEVKSHLNQSGHASFHKTKENEMRQVALTTSKCIVFLIKGTFKAGEVTIDANGLGHPVEDEGFIKLEEKTHVVIITTN